MRTNNNLYISDLLTVPMPKHATSHSDYLRRVKNRRIVWGLLPYLIEAVAILIFTGLTVFGISALVLGLGG